MPDPDAMSQVDDAAPRSDDGAIVTSAELADLLTAASANVMGCFAPPGCDRSTLTQAAGLVALLDHVAARLRGPQPDERDRRALAAALERDDQEAALALARSIVRAERELIPSRDWSELS
jgi:hypothetical protein